MGIKIPVMVATDGSGAGRQSSLYAVRLAKVLPLKITLVHAVRGLDRLEYRMISDVHLEMIEQGARRHAQEVLDREATILEEHGLELERLLLQGEPGTALCSAAEEEDTALLVVGRCGHGDLHDFFFGSVCNHVINQCRRPVLVVNRGAQADPVEDLEVPLRILVALDESEASQRVVEYLATLALHARDGMELSLTHIVNRDRPDLQHLPAGTRYEALHQLRVGGQDVLLAAAERLRGLGYRVEHQVEEGSVGKTLCRLSHDGGQEIVLLGRREGDESSRHMFGAVCHYVAHHCPAHVWIAI